MSDEAIWKSRLDRERRARKEAEALIENRSHELFEANAKLLSEIELRVEAERHLKIYEEVIRNTGEAVAITDAEGRIVEVNPAYQRATGRSREEVVGTPLHVPGRDPHPEDFYRDLWRQLRNEGHWSGEVLDRRKNGEPFPCWALINIVRDEQGKPLHYVCVSRDITALKRNEQQLQKLAFYDSLTGLANRALFKDRLTMALAAAKRRQALVAVLYLDLDRFKYVNDTLGHQAGDRLLVEVGERIGRCARSSDTIARMGGDEFTVLLADLVQEREAVEVAQRIVAAVGQSVALGDEKVFVGASVGISYFPGDGTDAETLQKNADVAMYHAKHAGRGQYCVFAPGMLARDSQRLTLSVRIDAALKNDEFRLVYQPIVNFASGRAEGVEALLRWDPPGGEPIPPATFIPHAEQAGLIKRLDFWALERACRDAAGWLAQDGRELLVSVNVSPMSLLQPDFAQLVRGVLDRAGLPARLVNLEITESAVSRDPQIAYAALDEITALGVGVSVKDFGTGYSTLSYMSQFRISCLKLDRSIIDRIGKDEVGEEIIRTLLGLARKFNVRVVAEGVQQSNQEAFLRQAGCELVQGFHIANPMPAGELAGWFAKLP